jgi:hypothetical protein
MNDFSHFNAAGRDAHGSMVAACIREQLGL